MSLLAGVGAAGCGGDSKHDANDDHAGKGGISASGGSGGSVHGGSGGSTPEGTGGTSGTNSVSTPAAVGLSISLSPPQQSGIDVDIGSRTCPAGGSGAATYTIGKPAPGGTIANGTNGISVECSVLATGAVSATVSGVDSTTGQRISLNFIGALDKTSAMSPAQLQFYVPSTGPLHNGSPFPDCTVGPITTLKTGAVLADFSCPILIATDDTTAGCAVHGTLGLEYCSSGDSAP